MVKRIKILTRLINADNFWICGQPFIMVFDEELGEEDSVLDLGGWNPKDSIGFCAMCNNQSSHVLLAMVAIKVAEITEGMILLECISQLTNSHAILTLEGHVKVNENDYVVSPSYLGNWVGSGDFRLLK